MSCFITEGTFSCVNERQVPQKFASEPVEPLTKAEYTQYILMAIVLVLSAGLMSGLTVGLAAIDRLSLEVEATGNPEIKK